MADPNFVSGVRDAAAALNMPPEWLATIISYETGGTLDPTKVGPTTRWGQHRGFIQFGEPQAMQYGVNWDDPLNSQLGADGAVVRYFLDRGWQPGMSFTDAYSIVNAGAPGRYNASDTAAGGAPGTVTDKVQTMQPHFDRVSPMFSPDATPEERNATISAMMAGGVQGPNMPSSPSPRPDTATASQAGAGAVTMSSSSPDTQRRPSPFSEALRLSYDPVSTDPLSDPQRDGVLMQFVRR